MIGVLINYIKYNIKVLVGILVVIALLIAITSINQRFINGTFVFKEKLYENELAKKVTDNDVDDVTYALLNDDLNSIDGILKEQLSLDIDKNKKCEYYKIAEEVYTEKINELTMVFNRRLDDEDFERLLVDLDDFDRNLDFAIEDMDRTLESSFDKQYYTYKYLYEEKQKKCREILEAYKGFLQ